MPDEYRLPRGRQPYDAYNGARVGGLVGGLLGTVPAFVLGPVWAAGVLVGGAVGAGAGYLWERRRIAADREAQRPD
jgi:hypothetical protein